MDNNDVDVRLEDSVPIKDDTDSRIEEIDVDDEIDDNRMTRETALVGDDYAEAVEEEEDDDEEGIDDLYIRQAAQGLLMGQTLPKIIVHYEATDFLLFNCDDSGDELISILVEDGNLVNEECSEMMKYIRASFERYYGRLAFMSKEICLTIPSLDLTVYEDNQYNNKITMSDIISIFNILRERSLKNNEPNVPDHLELNVTLRQRFIMRYNSLVELTENDEASIANIHPFSNDKNDPVVLED